VKRHIPKSTPYTHIRAVVLLIYSFHKLNSDRQCMLATLVALFYYSKRTKPFTTGSQHVFVERRNGVYVSDTDPNGVCRRVNDFFVAVGVPWTVKDKDLTYDIWPELLRRTKRLNGPRLSDKLNANPLVHPFSDGVLVLKKTEAGDISSFIFHRRGRNLPHSIHVLIQQKQRLLKYSNVCPFQRGAVKEGRIVLSKPFDGVTTSPSLGIADVWGLPGSQWLQVSYGEAKAVPLLSVEAVAVAGNGAAIKGLISVHSAYPNSGKSVFVMTAAESLGARAALPALTALTGGGSLKGKMMAERVPRNLMAVPEWKVDKPLATHIGLLLGGPADKLVHDTLAGATESTAVNALLLVAMNDDDLSTFKPKSKTLTGKVALLELTRIIPEDVRNVSTAKLIALRAPQLFLAGLYYSMLCGVEAMRVLTSLPTLDAKPLKPAASRFSDPEHAKLATFALEHYELSDTGSVDIKELCAAAGVAAPPPGGPGGSHWQHRILRKVFGDGAAVVESGRFRGDGGDGTRDPRLYVFKGARRVAADAERPSVPGLA
jgi:hypothetical protein